MCERIADELEGINLGDKRLNKRSKHVLEALAKNPSASINTACDGWSDTIAAYRFFDNDAVTPSEILRPHREATIGRVRKHRVVLLVQVTTELDFTTHLPKNAGCLNDADRFGLDAHVHPAVTPERLNLGVAAIDYFDRAPETLGKSQERSRLPIEETESFRWLEGYRSACRIAAECPDTRIVSVADREGDIYDIFVAAKQQFGSRADFIVCLRVERCTLEPNPAAGTAAFCKIRDEVAAAAVLTTRTIELGETPTRKARIAQIKGRVLSV